MDPKGLGSLRLRIGKTQLMNLPETGVLAATLYILLFNSSLPDKRPVRVHRNTRMVTIDGDSIEWEENTFELQAKEDWTLVVTAEFQLKGNILLQTETNGLRIPSFPDVISFSFPMYKKVTRIIYTVLQYSSSMCFHSIRRSVAACLGCTCNSTQVIIRCMR